MIGTHRRGSALIVTILALMTAPQAMATWSIVIADTETREVAAGTVTCLNNYDLLAIVPVVVVGKGAGACQASGDFDGIRRPVMFAGIQAGTSPDEILAQLAGISGHQSRQYGIADVQGRTMTFTGSQTFQWAGGVTGSLGTMHYAAQGNILTGDCVVEAIEEALLNTPGDIPEKLMAGMRAARAAGGDGRCSCNPNAPMSCGCPPFTFAKSGHIGGMIVARVGDVDDTVCNAGGCADGDYLLRINVAFQSSGQPDPVFQLQALFDEWRAGLVGRPDAIQSFVVFDPPCLPANGSSQTTMHIVLLDWTGATITAPVSDLVVEHADDSAGISIIGTPTDNGDGTFSVPITAGTGSGMDRFTVTVDDGTRPVVLAPPPSLEYFPPADLTGDGQVNLDDLPPFAGCLGGPGETSPPPGCGGCDFGRSDLDGDGDADLQDAAEFAALFGS